MSEYKIEKGIPVPDRRGGGRPYSYPFRHMEVGDSFLSEVMLKCITSAQKQLGIKCVQRKVEGGYRVWRVE